MKSLTSLYTRAFAFLLVIATLIAPGISSANSTCSELFQRTRHVAPIQREVAPAEYNYISAQDGIHRIIKDGHLWQMIGNQWMHVGYGRVQNGLIYEDQLFPNYTHQIQVHLQAQQGRRTQHPDLTPVHQGRYDIHVTQGERYFPNVNSSHMSTIHVIQTRNHKIEVISALTSNTAWAVNGVVNLVAALPQNRIESLRTIRVNSRESKNDPRWRQQYRNFNGAAAEAGSGEIDIYAIGLNDFGRGTQEGHRLMRHEFGHLIASTIFGSPHPDNLYIRTAQNDRHTVSDYGNNAWCEDFAEGIELYLRTNAGRLDPNIRNQLVNRFAYFDDVFNYRNPQSVKPKAERTENQKAEIFSMMIDPTHLLLLSPELGVGLLFDFDLK